MSRLKYFRSDSPLIFMSFEVLCNHARRAILQDALLSASHFCCGIVKSASLGFHSGVQVLNAAFHLSLEHRCCTSSRCLTHRGCRIVLHVPSRVPESLSHHHWSIGNESASGANATALTHLVCCLNLKALKPLITKMNRCLTCFLSAASSVGGLARLLELAEINDGLRVRQLLGITSSGSFRDVRPLAKNVDVRDHVSSSSDGYRHSVSRQNSSHMPLSKS